MYFPSAFIIIISYYTIIGRHNSNKLFFIAYINMMSERIIGQSTLYGQVEHSQRPGDPGFTLTAH